MTERTMPHNLEAERALLGMILLDNAAINTVVGIITKEDFYSENHRILFGEMLTLSEQSKAIDFVTLTNSLGPKGLLGKAGGVTYMSSLTDGVPIGSSVPVSEYCRIVKEASTVRRLINASNNTLVKCYEATDDAQTLIELAQSQIFEIAEQRTQSGFETIRQIATTQANSLDHIFKNGREHTGIDTGLVDLDSLTCGLQKQELIVVAGPTSIGKTAWAICVMRHAAVLAEKKVGLFSLEMSKNAIMTRLLCLEARIDSHKLRTGFCSREDHLRAAAALGRLANAPIYIDDTAGQTIPQIRAKARRLKAEHGLDLLVVDYLQLVAPGKKCENRTQEVSYVSRSLKAIAKELDVPLIALSQLSRAPDKRKTTRPMLSDLRESGTIEQDSDVVIFIWVNPRDKEEGTDDAQKSTLILAKQRNGPTGDVPMAFLRPYAKFENYEAPREDAPPPGEWMPHND